MSNRSFVELHLSGMKKDDLVEMVKATGEKPGDYCRLPKSHFVLKLVRHWEEHGSIPGLSLPAMQAVPAAVSPVAPVAFEAPAAPVTHAGRSAMGFEVKQVGTEKLGKLFGITGQYRDIEVPIFNDPDAPEFDPMYRFDPKKLGHFARNLPHGVWIFGPAGTGKTEFVKNFAAKCGRSFIRVSLDAGIERYELLGGERMRNGSTVYMDGLVLNGMRRPGAIILLDEVTIGRAEHLAALHGILDSGIAVIQETHEKVRKAFGVDFCVADNSNGRGDTSGVYAGIREMNFAFTDRYGWFEYFDYLSEEMERKVLVDRTGCTLQLAELLVKLMKACRASSEAGNLEIAPTLRQVMSLARNLTWGFPPREAWEGAVVNRASQDAQEILQQLWKANVSDEAVKAALAGKSAVVTPAMAATNTPPF
jgi:cobaltochelatase CobS